MKKFIYSIGTFPGYLDIMAENKTDAKRKIKERNNQSPTELFEDNEQFRELVRKTIKSNKEANKIYHSQ